MMGTSHLAVLSVILTACARTQPDLCKGTPTAPTPANMRSIVTAARPNPAESIEQPLGVGFIRIAPAMDAPPGDFTWIERLELPMASAPGRAPDRAFSKGWLVDKTGGRGVLRGSDLLEVGYEELALVVLERRDDGWMRLRLARDSAAWVPPCARTQAGFSLDFASWDSVLADKPLFFRGGAERVLHASPDSGGGVAIGKDHIMKPIEIRGDWMHVDVAEPSDYCFEDTNSRRTTGWIRWRDPRSGPLVWFFTRGC